MAATQAYGAVNTVPENKGDRYVAGQPHIREIVVRPEGWICADVILDKGPLSGSDLLGLTIFQRFYGTHRVAGSGRTEQVF